MQLLHLQIFKSGPFTACLFASLIIHLSCFVSLSLLSHGALPIYPASRTQTQSAPNCVKAPVCPQSGYSNKYSRTEIFIRPWTRSQHTITYALIYDHHHILIFIIVLITTSKRNTMCKVILLPFTCGHSIPLKFDVCDLGPCPQLFRDRKSGRDSTVKLLCLDCQKQQEESPSPDRDDRPSLTKSQSSSSSSSFEKVTTLRRLKSFSFLGMCGLLFT